jgi:ribosomal protein S12 methylthiotransferase
MQKSQISKVILISLGCPKNLVDSQIMAKLIEGSEYEFTDSEEQADIAIVNTCGFIEDAKAESIGRILEVAQLKKTANLKRLIVTGCLSQRYQDELVNELPEVDAFLGVGDFPKIVDVIRAQDKVAKFGSPTYLQKSFDERLVDDGSATAYVKIAEGCSKKCAFCAIPLIRGSLQSRTIEEIVKECEWLVSKGKKELILVSHDFTSFGKDLQKKGDKEQTPARLLKDLCKISGLCWLRVLYLYPEGLSSELIDVFAQEDKVCKYFDLPLQHISDSVLKDMKRPTNKTQIQSKLLEVRKKIPEASIRSQFIVGYPGETEEHFEELLEFLSQARIEHLGCFVFSEEEGTAACELKKERVSQEVAQDRKDQIMALQNEISQQIQESHLGQTYEVLVEGVSQETELLLQGRSRFQSPEIDGVTYINDGTANPGDLVQVKITEVTDYDLVGEIVNS